MLCSSQLPVTPTPENLRPSFRHCGYLHTCYHAFMRNTHIYISFKTCRTSTAIFLNSFNFWLLLKNLSLHPWTNVGFNLHQKSFFCAVYGNLQMVKMQRTIDCEMPNHNWYILSATPVPKASRTSYKSGQNFLRARWPGHLQWDSVFYMWQRSCT